MWDDTVDNAIEQVKQTEDWLYNIKSKEIKQAKLKLQEAVMWMEAHQKKSQNTK